MDSGWRRDAEEQREPTDVVISGTRALSRPVELPEGFYDEEVAGCLEMERVLTVGTQSKVSSHTDLAW